jgi:hypothetical protein
VDLLGMGRWPYHVPAQFRCLAKLLEGIRISTQMANRQKPNGYCSAAGGNCGYCQCQFKNHLVNAFVGCIEPASAFFFPFLSAIIIRSNGMGLASIAT